MIKRKININAVDISIWIIVLLKKKETGLLPYGYRLNGVLVSFYFYILYQLEYGIISYFNTILSIHPHLPKLLCRSPICRHFRSILFCHPNNFIYQPVYLRLFSFHNISLHRRCCFFWQIRKDF